MDDLKRLNDELNRKLKEQTAKVGTKVTVRLDFITSGHDVVSWQVRAAEQERTQSKQRAASLQQEVNRLRQEYLVLKEGLNSEQQAVYKHVDQMNALRKQLGQSDSQDVTSNCSHLRSTVHVHVFTVCCSSQTPPDATARCFARRTKRSESARTCWSATRTRCSGT